MALVFSYIRFSTKKQLDGDSYRRQSTRAANFIERGKHTLADLTLKDMGVSAYRGKHKHQGALSIFLKAINDGKVPKGSILLVENLDRLSREGVNEAFLLFNQILQSGVKIAVLTPIERIYDKKSINDIAGLIEPLIAFSLAHDESKKKSDRIREHWNEARKDATNKPVSKRRPSWIDWDEKNGFVLNKKRAKAIRYIFKRTIEGIGQRQLLGELIERFEPMGTSKRWNMSFIQKVLTDPATYGHFQLHEFDEEGNRVPSGEPIANYYPAAIDEQTFHTARTSSHQRYKIKPGRQKEFINVLSGLVFNARDKSVMHIQNTRAYTKKTGERLEEPRLQRRFVSYLANRKEPTACRKSFFVDRIEEHVILHLRTIRLEDLEPKRDLDKIEKAKNELQTIKIRLAELQAAMEDPSNPLPQLLAATNKLKEKRKKLENIVAADQFSGAEPINMLHTMFRDGTFFEPTDDRRKKLREILQRVVNRIDLFIWEINPRRVGCVVQMKLANEEVSTHVLAKGITSPFPLSCEEKDQFDLEFADKKELARVEKMAREWHEKYA